MKQWLLLIFLLPATAYCQPNTTYTNLVMEGGGVRGLAYAGALKVLEQKGVLSNIENVAGSSAGAIAALMVSLGYTSHEIDSILYPLKIQQFNDGKLIFGKVRRIKNEYGIFKGDKYEKWLSNLIAYKTGNENTTFADLHELRMKNKLYKDLYCTGTNITRQQPDIFSWQRTPLMPLKTAVHISGCIPIYFKPVALDSFSREVPVNKRDTTLNLYVDGGMLFNFPINIFDSCTEGICTNPLLCNHVKYNRQTLGLKLERSEQISEFNNDKTDIAPYSIRSLSDYMTAVMNLMMESINRKSAGLENELGRTIYISYDNISGRPRKTTDAEKQHLFENGVTAVENFFDKKTLQ